MGRQEAEHAAKRSMQAGYYHHSYDEERKKLRMFLEGKNGSQSVATQAAEMLNMYAARLAPDPFRAKKNAALAIVTNLCRAVAGYGVDMEFSFSLSDYYFNIIETAPDESRLLCTVEEILLHYQELALREPIGSYSLPVIRSIRHIRQHLYDRCRPSDVAGALHLHPNYLSGLFHRETGLTISQYIKKEKLSEAKYLLLHDTYSILEISELLGYDSPSYFSSDFKKHYGLSPRQYAAAAIS